MTTTTDVGRWPDGFLAYGEIVMAAPARRGDLAHRPTFHRILDPAPAGSADVVSRTGQNFVRPACEPDPDPAATTDAIGWRDADTWQMSAGWADWQHDARPCPDAQCFPDRE